MSEFVRSPSPWVKGINGAAEYTGASVRTIHRWIDNGDLIPRHHSQRMLFFRCADLDEAIEKIAERYKAEEIV